MPPRVRVPLRWPPRRAVPPAGRAAAPVPPARPREGLPRLPPRSAARAASSRLSVKNPTDLPTNGLATAAPADAAPAAAAGSEARNAAAPPVFVAPSTALTPAPPAGPPAPPPASQPPVPRPALPFLATGSSTAPPLSPPPLGHAAPAPATALPGRGALEGQAPPPAANPPAAPTALPPASLLAGPLPSPAALPPPLPAAPPPAGPPALPPAPPAAGQAEGPPLRPHEVLPYFHPFGLAPAPMEDLAYLEGQPPVCELAKFRWRWGGAEWTYRYTLIENPRRAARAAPGTAHTLVFLPSIAPSSSREESRECARQLANRGHVCILPEWPGFHKDPHINNRFRCKLEPDEEGIYRLREDVTCGVPELESPLFARKLSRYNVYTFLARIGAERMANAAERAWNRWTAGAGSAGGAGGGGSGHGGDGSAGGGGGGHGASSPGCSRSDAQSSCTVTGNGRTERSGDGKSGSFFREGESVKRGGGNVGGQGGGCDAANAVAGGAGSGAPVGRSARTVGARVFGGRPFGDRLFGGRLSGDRPSGAPASASGAGGGATGARAGADSIILGNPPDSATPPRVTPRPLVSATGAVLDASARHTAVARPAGVPLSAEQRLPPRHRAFDELEDMPRGHVLRDFLRQFVRYVLFNFGGERPVVFVTQGQAAPLLLRALEDLDELGARVAGVNEVEIANALAATAGARAPPAGAEPPPAAPVTSPPAGTDGEACSTPLGGEFAGGGVAGRGSAAAGLGGAKAGRAAAGASGAAARAGGAAGGAGRAGAASGAAAASAAAPAAAGAAFGGADSGAGVSDDISLEWSFLHDDDTVPTASVASDWKTKGVVTRAAARFAVRDAVIADLMRARVKGAVFASPVWRSDARAYFDAQGLGRLFRKQSTAMYLFGEACRLHEHITGIGTYFGHRKFDHKSVYHYCVSRFERPITDFNVHRHRTAMLRGFPVSVTAAWLGGWLEPVKTAEHFEHLFKRYCVTPGGGGAGGGGGGRDAAGPGASAAGAAAAQRAAGGAAASSAAGGESFSLPSTMLLVGRSCIDSDFDDINLWARHCRRADAEWLLRRQAGGGEEGLPGAEADGAAEDRGRPWGDAGPFPEKIAAPTAAAAAAAAAAKGAAPVSGAAAAGPPKASAGDKDRQRGDGGFPPFPPLSQPGGPVGKNISVGTAGGGAKEGAGGEDSARGSGGAAGCGGSGGGSGSAAGAGARSSSALVPHPTLPSTAAALPHDPDLIERMKSTVLGAYRAPPRRLSPKALAKYPDHAPMAAVRAAAADGVSRFAGVALPAVFGEKDDWNYLMDYDPERRYARVRYHPYGTIMDAALSPLLPFPRHERRRMLAKLAPGSPDARPLCVPCKGALQCVEEFPQFAAHCIHQFLTTGTVDFERIEKEWIRNPLIFPQEGGEGGERRAEEAADGASAGDSAAGGANGGGGCAAAASPAGLPHHTTESDAEMLARNTAKEFGSALDKAPAKSPLDGDYDGAADDGIRETVIGDEEVGNERPKEPRSKKMNA